ncbi:MAG: nucleotide-binding protein [Prolixibacteraceae bacterium]|nr:nucleotide-binding protein [Prolixibacteraceae bacterium]
MDKISILFAKFAGLQKNFNNIAWSSGRTGGSIVEHLLSQFDKCRIELKELMPELFSDLPDVKIPEPYGRGGIKGETIYTIYQVTPILQNIDYILEVRTNYRVGEKIENEARPQRVFISHGRSKEWYKIQAYIEKDIKLESLELAQEPILGRTVLQKLNDEAGRCGYAVIVMTGDDIVGEEVRARENVMHEVGFFQGKYGLQNVTLLHEEGVNIPSNIHGLVYIPFPKDTVEATFGALSRELKAQLT